MIFKSPISNRVSKKINWVILFFLFPLLIVGCSDPEMKDTTREALPQFLEELQIEQTEEETRYAMLVELHNLQPETYLVGSGNVFDIKVFAYGEEQDEYTTRNAIVKSDGTITINYINEDINILGLTIPEAKIEISRHITGILEPKVAMNPLKVRSSRVTIMGQAQIPGNYQIFAGMRILDVLAEAKGFKAGIVDGTTKELADLSGSFIVRNNKVLPVDFLELVRKGNQLHNIPVQDGDYIFISSLANQELYILGEIMKPDAYLYKENLSMVQLIAFAGGLTKDARSKVYMIRGSLSHPRIFIIDLNAVLRGNARDIVLKPNDIVYVPKTLLADWNAVITQILPSFQAIQSAYITNNIIEDMINDE